MKLSKNATAAHKIVAKWITETPVYPQGSRRPVDLLTAFIALDELSILGHYIETIDHTFGSFKSATLRSNIRRNCLGYSQSWDNGLSNFYMTWLRKLGVITYDTKDQTWSKTELFNDLYRDFKELKAELKSWKKSQEQKRKEYFESLKSETENDQIETVEHLDSMTRFIPDNVVIETNPSALTAAIIEATKTVKTSDSTDSTTELLKAVMEAVESKGSEAVITMLKLMK
jgi:hypothetical protein